MFNKLRTWYYLHKYPPLFTLTVSGVKVHFSAKCNSPKVLRRVCFVPVRLFDMDVQVAVSNVNTFVRLAFVK